MPRPSWFRMSLARKVSVLFGTAVLLTICVTLLFPWLQMTNLHEEVLLVEAKGIAMAAYLSVDPNQPDWSLMQAQLEERWPRLSRRMGLAACPRFVGVGPLPPSGFRAEAIGRLTANPAQRYYWKVQNDGRLFRFAMAVRGKATDPHPHVLRGIIDVRLPIPQAGSVWNSVITVLAGASGAVLAILVFYMVTQRLVLTPVTTLRHAAEQVTTGDIDARTAINSGDEFQDLSDAFNDMLTSLKAAQEELQTTNRSLDIKLGELAETNLALFESNRLKSQFLANVSHELRTPLASIIGFAELLRDAWQEPEADRRRLARYSEHILTSGRSLLDIINDLLDLAKIEAGKMELHVSQFAMDELCTDLVDFIRPLADKKKQKLILDLPNTPLPFHSDSGKVKQILYNLLSNAVKFTPAGGRIQLSVVQTAPDAVEIIVRDTGPGIPPERIGTIFEKFHQLDSSKTREHEGTGLGLAITQELAHMLGGSIRLDSRPGEGTTFTVAIPAIKTPPAKRRRVPLS